MIVDTVVDANPVVGRVAAVPVNEAYPDSKLCKDLLFRIAMKNLTESSVKIDVEFKVKNKDKKLNMAYPTGGLLDFLKPSLSGTLITLHKINPDGETINFDDLEIKVTQQNNSDNAFQMNSFASQSDIPNTQKTTSASGGQNQNFSIVPQNIKD